MAWIFGYPENEFVGLSCLLMAAIAPLLDSSPRNKGLPPRNKRATPCAITAPRGQFLVTGARNKGLPPRNEGATAAQQILGTMHFPLATIEICTHALLISIEL